MDIKLKDDINIEPGSDDFWYNVTIGGYFKPEDVMSDEVQITEMKEALLIVRQLEDVYDDHAPEY